MRFKFTDSWHVLELRSSTITPCNTSLFIQSELSCSLIVQFHKTTFKVFKNIIHDINTTPFHHK